METKILTKSDFNSKNEFIGDESILSLDGNLEIAENLKTVYFRFLAIRGYILAKTGTGIEAGYGIEAGEGIEAGYGIKAGDGIEAGLAITCKLKLVSGLRIFAGLCSWQEPTKGEQTITCGLLESGKICFGTLVEKGLPEVEKGITHTLINKLVEVKIDGITYEAKIINQK